MTLMKNMKRLGLRAALLLVFMIFTTVGAWADDVTSGTCGDYGNENNVTWAVTDEDQNGTYETITISGTGKMANYSFSNQPWAAFKSELTTAVIGDGVTSIGNEAFCEFSNLATVSGGSNVTSIGRYGFDVTKWVDNLPSGLTYVGHVAYRFKGEGGSVTLDKNTTQIYRYCFYNSLITSIVIPASVTDIGDNAFQESLLKKVYVLRNRSKAEEITQLGSNAFYYCNFLHDIIVPADAYDAYDWGWNPYRNIIRLGYTITCNEGITATTYAPIVASGEKVTLGYTGTIPEGYAIVYIVKDADDNYVDVNYNNGVYSFYMPPSHVTVSAEIVFLYWSDLKKQLANASTNADAPTVITLNHDVVAYISESKDRLEVPAGRHAVIDLNGHKIDRNLSDATSSGEVIKVMNNNSNTNPATLTIRDSQGGGQITGGYTQAGGGGIFVSGSLTLEGGTICGNHANGNGGAVNISGTFTMKGGCITNNSCGSYGSGIYTNGGTIYLQGGTITGNKGSEAIYTDHDLNVSGRYDVSGNTLADGKTEAPDIVLVGKVINIAGAISPVNPATVAFASGGPTLTSGWSTYMSTGDPADCFTTPFASSNIVARIGDELHLGTPETIYWHGDYAHDGTSEEKAYIITTPEGLEYLATYVNDGNSTNGKYFKLGNDIDMSCISNFTPIGDHSHMFMGVFDGQDYTISGLTINQPDNDYIGLFDKNDGLIQNVIISGASITGKCYVGGIAGKNNETIKNCFVIGTSIIAYDLGGAILGENMNGSLYNNYYHNCTLITQIHDPATTFIGTKNGDYSNHNGAMQVLALIDDADNTNVFADMDGFAKGVYLEGRTLYRDGGWNTLCLPFTINANEIAASPLAGAEIRALSSSSLENGTLTLTFTPATGEGAVTYIEAGKPYIIRWAEAATNIVNPLFRGVTMGTNNRNFTSIDGKVSFKGTYAPITFTEEDKSILFLGEENTLYYPQPDLTDPDHPKYPRINAFRAYFHLSDGAGVKAFNLNFGENEPLSIFNSSGMKRPFGPSGQFSIGEADGAWYDMQGRRFNSKPAKAGIYIYGNEKIVIN